MGELTLKDLLEAGVHFGHQTKRWNPKMKPFIFMEKNGIHIIDLQKTLENAASAREAIRKVAEKGKDILFLGTKPQAKKAIQEEAMRCGMPYVTERWLGGTLTNFDTIRKSLDKLEHFEKLYPESLFRIGYEALTDAPVEQIDRLLSALGEDPAAITYDLSKVRPERNQYRTTLTPEQVDTVMRATEAQRERLGYAD